MFITEKSGSEMSGTLIKYVEDYGVFSFEELPFSAVDALVLSQFMYMKFDGIVQGFGANRPWVSMKEVRQHKEFEKVFADERFEKQNRILFELLYHSVRFGDCKFNFYENRVDRDWEVQFCAMTIMLGNGKMFVAYRGTDENIIGWKEDFNMACLSPVPCQSLSVKYMNQVGEVLPGPLLTGGHSKGGNLAIYSSAKCRESIRARIEKIYCLDGPGFREGVLEKGELEKIADKIEKVVPHSSLVGMMFENEIPYRVVESKNIGLAQHNPFSWKVKGGDFLSAKAIYSGRKFLDDTINRGIKKLSKEQIRQFNDILFQIIDASEAEDLITFTVDKKKSMLGMVNACRELDEESEKALKEVISVFFEAASKQILHSNSK